MTDWDDHDLARPPNVEGGTIAGRVTDSKEVPLPGVRIEAAATGGGDLDLLPEITDAHGRFELTGLTSGRYDLRFSLGQVKARVLAVPTGTDQLRVRLARPQGLMLVFRSIDDAPPPPLYHYTLKRIGKTNNGTPNVVCEDVGATLKSRILLWSIRPGHYIVTAWGGPYLPVEVNDIVVKPDDPAPEVEVLLAARGATIHGHTRGRDGAPVESLINVRRTDQPCHVPRQLTTQETTEQGEFWLRGLPEGDYLLTAYRDDLGFTELPLHVDDDDLESETPLTIDVHWP